MGYERPDPDALLKQVQVEEGQTDRGRLKIFLGASAGVGKTYAMLSEAHEQLERGVDVAIGYVETHGRRETEALVEGLPSLPQRTIRYRGVVLSEFDLDGALRRKPELVLVDELPHTNAPESRHPKRWQDVEELLNAGVNVLTAINIQHIESLRDVVAQVTGIYVQETVPDAFIDRADEIELIDIPPDELRQRLKEGKVYISEKIDQALEGFFKKGNLLALRELALRRTADRVESDMQPFREASGGIWATRERVLVCIAPNRLGERVVRTTSRLGLAAHAKLYALYVESDRQKTRSAEDQACAEEALRLAERLGMETARRASSDIVNEVLDFARKRNITLVVVGKPIKPRWREVLFGSVVDELVRRSGEINVHVISGDAAPERPRWRVQSDEKHQPKEYVHALTATIIATGIGAIFHSQKLPNENVMALFLLAIAYVGGITGPRATLLCCVLSVLDYDFFFVHPEFSFSVSDLRYLPTFGVMLVVALLISRLTFRMREQADVARSRERRTAALYDLSREMAKSRSKEEIALASSRKIRDEFEFDATVLLPDDSGSLKAIARSRSHFEKDYKEWPVAQWAFEHGLPAGAGTDTLPGAGGFYIPVVVDKRVLGVLGVKAFHEEESIEPSQRTLLETFANGMALALERATLAKESHEARLAAEAEKIRSSLLSSVSHDIRTPLTTIAGAASSLVEGQGDEKELGRLIYNEAMRLNRHVRNLLDITRLEAGSVQPKLEWNSLEEIVGSAMNRTEGQFQGRQIEVELLADLPLVRVDGPLIEQALVNLLENAARHTPTDAPVEVAVTVERNEARIEVRDRGAGVAERQRPHLFEKFHQSRPDDEGFGLGLAIVSAVMRIHGGKAEYYPRSGGGSVFQLFFPTGGEAPEVPLG